jgi:hypothetical protein
LHWLWPQLRLRTRTATRRSTTEDTSFFMGAEQCLVLQVLIRSTVGATLVRLVSGGEWLTMKLALFTQPDTLLHVVVESAGRSLYFVLM